MSAMLSRILLLIVVFWPGVSLAQDDWQGISRIVVFGDLHGDYGQYVKLLELNGLVDKRLHWIGGKTHFVQLGDVPDRGPDTFKIMKHLEVLEREARHAGGYVHALIGDHEAMNIQADLRYVNPAAYQALVTRRSENLRQAFLGRVFNMMLAKRPELRSKREETIASLEKRVPLGYVEYRQLWSPHAELRKWVEGHNTVIRIDRTLFVHGGIDPHLPFRPIAQINAAVRSLLRDTPPPTPSLLDDENGPLWYRGLARHSAATEEAAVRKMLAHYDVDRIVIGHTPTGTGHVVSRFGGMVILDDVGITAAYGSHLANLVIEGKNLFEVTPGGKSPLE